MDVAGVAALSKLLLEEQRARRRGEAGGRSKEEWRVLLDDCIRAPQPQLREWRHGAPSRADGAEGAHLVFEVRAGR